MPEIDIHESTHPSLEEEENEQQRALKKYNESLVLFTSQSKFLKDTQPRSLGYFQFDELNVGPVLGVGAFATASEITGITLNVNTKAPPSFLGINTLGSEVKIDSNTVDVDSTSHYNLSADETRLFMSQNVVRGKANSARYAIKKLRDDLPQGQKRWRGMVDLSLEATLLSHLSHPNIIKMRAIANSKSPLYDDNFFIILDRLYMPLVYKIDKSWAASYKEYSGGIFKKENKEGLKSLLLEQVLVARDLSSAFQYLHKHRIIYRDMKSENIGFDIRGDVKLFDFGLATELLPKNKVDKNFGGLYKLTPKTGSIPYMAPEVMLGKPYNQKADVFSFAMLMWEMFAMKLPFEGFNRYDFIEKICKKNYRPSCDKKWPSLVKTLMKDCWSDSISDRPDFINISSMLKAESDDIAQDDPSVKDRTKHMMNKSNISRHHHLSEN